MHTISITHLLQYDKDNFPLKKAWFPNQRGSAHLNKKMISFEQHYIKSYYQTNLHLLASEMKSAFLVLSVLFLGLNAAVVNRKLRKLKFVFMVIKILIKTKASVHSNFSRSDGFALRFHRPLFCELTGFFMRVRLDPSPHRGHYVIG